MCWRLFIQVLQKVSADCCHALSTRCRAKNKNVGRNLREMLHHYGLDLQPGRRKTAIPTCFTALVEEEAHQMARDFGDLLRQYYPQRNAAAHLVSNSPASFPISAVRNELIATRQVDGEKGGQLDVRVLRS